MGKRYRLSLRLFGPVSYRKEEQFLQRMALSGWHLQSVHIPLYTFTRGRGGRYNYKLDFQSGEDREGYMQLFADMGWAHVCSVPKPGGYWHYFRRPGEAGEDAELYSDLQSQLDLVHRVRRRMLAPLLVLLLIGGAGLLIGRVTAKAHVFSFFSGFLSGIGGLFVVVCILFFLRSKALKQRLL